MASIPFKQEMSFTYGEVTVMSPLIRRVICNNPSAFTFTGTGTYLVGTGDVAVIDPGPLNEAHIDAICNALGPDERISHILITHTHADHSPAARPLQQRCNAPIYGYAVEAHTEQMAAPAVGDPIQLDEEHDADYAPDIILKDGDRIATDQWEIEVIHTPGHMANHLCFALINEKTLFTGDHVMGWSTSIVAPPEGNMFAYMQSLDRLLARDDQRYLPTHGPAIDNPQEFVRAYIAHRRAREAQIIDQLAQGVHRIGDMVPRLYTEIDPRLFPAAALSVFAHMEDLMTRKRVVCQSGRGLDGHYLLTEE